MIVRLFDHPKYAIYSPRRKCARRPAVKITHGHGRRGRNRSRAYQVWAGIIQRCTNVNFKQYKEYGGRGIRVCARWRKFENFLADMGEPPPSMSIDRIDNNRGYSPKNCRWATRREQQRNMRTSRWLTHAGKTKLLRVWAEEAGISFDCLRHRLKVGWSVATALREPSQRGK
jgi:hypothetical protein